MYFLLTNTLIAKKVAVGITCLYLAVIAINNNNIKIHSSSKIVTHTIISEC